MGYVSKNTNPSCPSHPIETSPLQVVVMIVVKGYVLETFTFRDAVLIYFSSLWQPFLALVFENLCCLTNLSLTTNIGCPKSYCIDKNIPFINYWIDPANNDSVAS